MLVLSKSAKILLLRHEERNMIIVIDIFNPHNFFYNECEFLFMLHLLELIKLVHSNALKYLHY